MALNGAHQVQKTASVSFTTVERPQMKAKTKITSGHNLNTLLYLMYARQNFQYCKAIIEQCLEFGCDLEYSYFVKGLITRQEGDPAEAIKCFQKAVEINSTNPENYREIAKTLYDIGRFKQSLEILIRTETLLKKPDCVSYYYIGKLLTRKDISKCQSSLNAKDYFVKAIQTGRHLESMKELAELHVKEGDWRKSIDLLETCLQINCDDVNVLTRMGILHLMAGDTQTAFTRLLDAMVVDANSPKLVLALGGILQARGDADGALNKYKCIIDWDDQGSELWSNLGLCFMRSQKLISAISCLRKSIGKAGLNFNALFNLGYVYMKAKLYVSAFYTLATALNLKPNHTEGIMLLGVCLSELHDKRNALAAFERAVGMPDAAKYPLAYLNLAIFSYQNQNYELSWRNVRRYLVLIDNPNNSHKSKGNGNHLKVARKLMCLLKLISSEPDADDKGISRDPSLVAEEDPAMAEVIEAAADGPTDDDELEVEEDSLEADHHEHTVFADVEQKV